MSKPMNLNVNPWEAACRRAKAERLAVNLHSAGVQACEVSRIEARFWAPLAKAAGVAPPSAQTILLVAEIMAEFETAQQRVSSMLFAGCA